MDRAEIIGAGLLLGALVAYVLYKGSLTAAAASAGAGLGGAVVAAADGAASGAVVAVGGLVGIPATDAQKCQAAMVAGNYTDASLYCPIATFTKFVISGGEVQAE